MPAARNSRPVRVALYARCSTGHQDTGLQMDELRLVAEQRGWVVVSEHVDDGVSGSTTTRPGIDALLREVQTGKVDVVAVWKLDRLARSLQHLLFVMDTLTTSGVAFASIRDAGIDTTNPTGRLLLQLLGAFAEFEKSLIRERVQAGVDRARRQGKHLGRPVVQVDLRPAVAMLEKGYGLKAVAAATGVPRSTLRRRLQEAGAVANPRSASHRDAPG